MATNTYVALGKVTTSGSVSSVEFTSISSAYTDLRIVVDVVGSGTGYVSAQFNGDTSTNYSITRLGANGSTTSSNRAASASACDLSWSAAYTSSTRLIETIDIMNYSVSTTYKTLLSRAGKADNAIDAIVGLWRSTAAITSVKLVANTANFATGSTFSLYGIAKSNAIPGTAKATGGTISYSVDGYTYHAFTASGTFTPSVSLSCDVMVLGGGGSGGTYKGGGGAGGLWYGTSQSVTATGYSVVVGAGGASGSAGVDSTFGALTAGKGGGKGGLNTQTFTYDTVLNGGCGGGGGNSGGGASGGNSNQASTGGVAYGSTGGDGQVQSGGGGGGLGGGGGTGFGYAAGGAGGVGTTAFSAWGQATTTGQNVNGVYYYGGGGGGIGYTTSTIVSGGYGGGGNSGNTTGVNGTANTGGGGGAQSSTGGSGIVIIRYAS